MGGVTIKCVESVSEKCGVWSEDGRCGLRVDEI